MSEQLEMFGRPVVAIVDSSKLTREEFFNRFHSSNPHVYAALVKLTREFLKKSGRRQIGIRLIWERMRWEFAIYASTDDAYRLNNVLTPFYAREIMRCERDLAGVFSTRERHAA